MNWYVTIEHEDGRKASETVPSLELGDVVKIRSDPYHWPEWVSDEGIWFSKGPELLIQEDDKITVVEVSHDITEPPELDPKF